MDNAENTWTEVVDLGERKAENKNEFTYSIEISDTQADENLTITEFSKE